jgi:hypothetical protein
LGRYRFKVYAEPGHFGGRETVSLADLAGTPVVTMPMSMQPSAMATMQHALVAAGVTDFTVIDLQDWIAVPQLLRRKRAATLGLGSPDSPMTSILSAGGMEATRLTDDVDFALGIAWRGDHPDPRIADLVAHVHPLPGEPPEEID